MSLLLIESYSPVCNTSIECLYRLKEILGVPIKDAHYTYEVERTAFRYDISLKTMATPSKADAKYTKPIVYGNLTLSAPSRHLKFQGWYCVHPR